MTSPEATPSGLGAALPFAEVSETGGVCTEQGASVDLPSSGLTQPGAEPTVSCLHATAANPDATEAYPPSTLPFADDTVSYPKDSHSGAIAAVTCHLYTLMDVRL